MYQIVSNTHSIIFTSFKYFCLLFIFIMYNVVLII